MAKTVRLEPLGKKTHIPTNDNLLSVLLKNELKVLSECQGRGICATCHIFIKEGNEHLSPPNRRELRTLQVISSRTSSSRLACQSRVLGDGVIVELPSGMYLNAVDDIEALIGRRAQEDILHPLHGNILVETGKLITRSMISQLEVTQGEIINHLANSQVV
ncbi:2Fe-2S iron-sulfur cluster-binding protein [Acaryochloris marina]|uniref:2Fe-2S iron-sulfur cluster-binding protein n=1 Tax=Acaryochloris marina TaxID=155978 RepID=UPI0021C4996E|nr:2Fe-2S iron-sulfur cluster-binding protein [Acaryochloris marina]BDM83331.1 ferredoxin [Acaryochloris marina MBIC10699]